jgi:hypothetical protein
MKDAVYIITMAPKLIFSVVESPMLVCPNLHETKTILCLSRCHNRALSKYQCCPVCLFYSKKPVLKDDVSR